jgi:CO dehydrogenase maturation factor
MSPSHGKVLAVTGKGGVGKSAIVGMMIKVLAREYDQPLLAIDADSAMSLNQIVGIPVNRTISDIRHEIINDPESRRQLKEGHIGTFIAKAVHRKGNLHLLVMGRPEGAGCFCAVNDLLKYGIQSLARTYPITIIDGEAGPEQINRRVLDNVDILVSVADTSLRSLQTAASIREIAEKCPTRMAVKTLLVINRIRPGKERIVQAAEEMNFEIAGIVPDDENISSRDMLGKTLLGLPEGSPAMAGVEDFLRHIGLYG